MSMNANEDDPLRQHAMTNRLMTSGGTGQLQVTLRDNCLHDVLSTLCFNAVWLLVEGRLRWSIPAKHSGQPTSTMSPQSSWAGKLINRHEVCWLNATLESFLWAHFHRADAR